MKRAMMAAAIAALAGCASSGIIPTGADTYMVTKKSAAGVLTSGSEIKAELYVEANSFCGHQGKVVDTISTTAQNAIPFARMPNAELQFRCVTTPPPTPAASSPT